MDKKLQIVKRIYDRDRSDENATGNGSSAEDVREEKLMLEAKFVMDHRQKLRPDPETIDRIVAHAAEAVVDSSATRRARLAAVPVSSAREDRSVRQSARIIPLALLRGRWQTAIAATFMLFVVGAALWRLYPGIIPSEVDSLSGIEQDESQLPATSESREALAAGSSRQEGEPVAKTDDADGALPAGAGFANDEAMDVGKARAQDPSLVGQPSRRSGELLVASAPRDGFLSEPDSIPAWSDPADLRLLQKRIEMLRRSGGELDWGAPAVPLEQLPASAVTPGIRAAGAGNNDRR